MQTVLFHSTIFGPIHSRRLGTSLGVNLMPRDGKVCSFDCLYCEAGYNAQGPGTSGLPSRADVAAELEQKLADMQARGDTLDVITFSGNGEPTLHPDFEGVVDDTMALRDRYFPAARVCVLCNSTMLGKPGVERALRRVDGNFLKLDSAVPDTFRLLNRPSDPTLTPARVVERMAQFGSACTVQTLLTRGWHDGHRVDNTTPAEVDALIAACRAIGPAEIQLYTIDRATPEQSLSKIPRPELEAIAERFRQAGLNVTVI